MEKTQFSSSRKKTEEAKNFNSRVSSSGFELPSMRRISCSRLILFSIGGAVVQIIGLSLFVFGFFPIKPALSGFSGPESFSLPVCDYVENQSDPSMSTDQLRLLYQDLSGVPSLFDRLVFMVIDGLPAEFVLGKDGKPPSLVMKEAMPYTQSLLENGLAIGYHAKAAPPTVTMPRLKAMVSGAIGGFLDVAFNFNTQALLDDNLIVKFSRIGWKMVMFGDETWLKLFPGVFTRHDGVSSFFVKDTVQVDHNVSRHLGKELSRDDWNLMILHYLGLDHVGHVGGRNSALMPPKLTEMDEVIKRIHSSIYQKEKDGGSTLLMVVSDHGMTKSGNHGGSSDEETDSLILLIGTGIHTSDYESSSHNFANQVDIAPTLALLIGVPIPTNNVGVLISAAFDTLADQHRLRVLELNSWQLLRLLRAQLPALPCSDFPCHLGELQISDSSYCNQSIESTVCCLYAKATLLHASWRSKNNSDVSKKDDYRKTVAAYDRFLRSSSEWLSRRTTDKPVDLLAVGLAMMSLSCLIFIILILHMRDVYLELRPQGFKSVSMDRWSLEEAFILFVILIVVACMGSSSMVEEEHYIWHFMMSTFYLLLLRKAALSFPVGGTQSNLIKKESTDPYFQLFLIFLLLISERILRGWHQGGVNWVNLPDISKWLDTAASGTINSLQLISALLVIGFGLLTLFLMQSSRKLLMVKLSFSISGLLVLLHIVKYQDDTFASSSYGATLLAQIIYTMLGASTVGTSVLLPWLTPSVCRMSTSKKILTQHSVPECTGKVFAVTELRDSLRVIGLAYILCWSFLQLLLQQPKNSSPILLLFVQIYVSMLYFSRAGSENYHQEWKEVAALHYLGIAGHFALGNSNTLATIDVAGAFIGISSHSTLLSGILMFVITYASPMFVLLSLVLYISMKITDNPEDLKNADEGIILSRILGYTCLVPLGINSVLLTAYTVILLLMRNHLFVWSVFSPKYLYVCAATVCTYVGVLIVAATGIYTYSVLALRWRMCKSKKL